MKLNLLHSTALAGALVSLLSGCGRDVQSQELAAADAPEIRVPVMTEAARTGDVKAFVRGNAVLEAAHRADVVSETSGLVTHILVEEGDTVERGQLLARLDTERSQLELIRAKARLEQLQGTFDRQREMVRRNMASQETLGQFQAEYEMQQAELALAELMLDKAQIRAPFAGVVTDRMIKLGQQVADSQVTFGVADFSSLEAVMSVPERNSAQLIKGQPVSIGFLALPDEQFEGSIVRVSPVVDPTTGTVRVTVKLDETVQLLRPGMLAQLAVQFEQHQATAMVPSEAIVLDESVPMVFVIDDGIARKVVVTTGLTMGLETEIVSGVDAGDVVVTAGQNRLNEGSPISVVAGP